MEYNQVILSLKYSGKIESVNVNVKHYKTQLNH